MTDHKFLRQCEEQWKELETETRVAYVTRVNRKYRGKNGFNREKIVKAAFHLFVNDYKEELEGTEFQDGAEGCIRWVEEKIRFKYRDGKNVFWLKACELPDLPDEYGRSVKKMWEEQKKEIRRLLAVLPNKRLKHRLGVFCWPRGEGKSVDVVLIGLWRFFNFPFHKVMVAASSKEQSGNSLLGEMVQIIENSPSLYKIVGAKGVTQSEIRITKGRKGRFSVIRQMSTHSGVMSNVNTVIQTEAFEMESDQFFAEWFGSLRDTPDALGLIDTTVSHKGHWLFRLYESAKNDPDGEIFFSYRYSQNGDPADFLSPGKTVRQMNTYRTTFSQFDFRRFFLNRWDASAGGVFSDVDVSCISFYGLDGLLGRNAEIRELVAKVQQQEETELSIRKDFERGENHEGHWESTNDLAGELQRRAMSVNDLIDLGGFREADERTGIRTSSRMVDLSVIQMLSDVFDTHWALGVGLDMADALKNMERQRTYARSVMAWVLKGLAGSKSMSKFERKQTDLSGYLYVVIGMAVFATSDSASVQQMIGRVDRDLGGVDQVGGENFAMAPIKAWCNQKKIPVRHWSPTLNIQAVGFNELILSSQNGRFLAPDIPIRGSRGGDILREEMGLIDCVSAGKWPRYFSPEKSRKHGIQDDALYSIVNAILGMNEITAVDFRERTRAFDEGMLGGVFDGMALVQDALRGLY